MSHWHAYTWTGHERPADSDRTNMASATPPLETAHWLRKSVKPEATWPIPEGAEEAYAWLRVQLDEHPRASHDLAPEPQLEYARDCLSRGADVVWGYYSDRGRYISRTLVVCPRPGERCPAPPAGT
jgi:hypothetical protein